jgi:hypothetical protein
MRFSSPSGNSAIEIWQRTPDNSWGARLVLASQGRDRVVSEQRRESIISFAHVYWSPNETQVCVVATGLIIWRLAFDVRTGEAIPFEPFRGDVAQSVRESYGLPSTIEDPIRWAATAEAQAAFFKRHREFRVTYH